MHYTFLPIQMFKVLSDNYIIQLGSFLGDVDFFFFVLRDALGPSLPKKENIKNV